MIETRVSRVGREEQPPSRLMSPWLALAVMALGLAFGALLNSGSLLETARSQPAGWWRDAAVTMTSRLHEFSQALRLDSPHTGLESFRANLEVETAWDPREAGEVFVPSAEFPVRLLVVGDSLVDPFGPAVVRASEATGLMVADWDVKYSSGLTRPELYDWHGELADRLAASPVDVLVFVVGANDAQPIETDSGWHSTGTPEWRAEYRLRVESLMKLFDESVATAYWVGQPIAQSARHSSNMYLLDGIYRSAAEEFEGVTYVDSWDVFADNNGEFSAYLPNDDGDLVLMRQEDGVHLTVAGSDRLAAVLLDVMALDWEIGR